jgi:hypothetical protein
LLEVYSAIKFFRHVLEGRQFIVTTNLSSTLSNNEQTRPHLVSSVNWTTSPSLEWRSSTLPAKIMLLPILYLRSTLCLCPPNSTHGRSLRLKGFHRRTSTSHPSTSSA